MRGQTDHREMAAQKQVSRHWPAKDAGLYRHRTEATARRGHRSIFWKRSTRSPWGLDQCDSAPARA